MMVMNNDVVTTQEQENSVSSNLINNKNDIKYYSCISNSIDVISNCIDNGYSIEKFFDILNDDFRSIPVDERCYFSKPETIKHAIGIVKNSFDNIIVIESDKRFWDTIKLINEKYNITETDTLTNKINELFNDTAALESIAAKINSIYPNKITNTESVVQFIDDTLQEAVAIKQVNQTFTNVNELIKQNALMKQQLDQLRSQILIADGNPVA